MRIIQASSYFYPHIGGVETHVLELAQSLQGLGHEVIVLCAAVPKSDPAEDLNGLRIYRFPALDLPYVPFIYALRRRIAQFSADVIHSHYPPPFMSYGAVKGLPHVPHVLTYHCDLEIPDHMANLRIPNIFKHSVQRVNNSLYAKPALNAVNKIIATTQSYAESSPLLQDYQYEVVPNGVRLQAFDKLHDANERELKQVLYVGRLSSVKGIEYLIKAAKIVLKEHEDATFLIVGDGEERQNLEALAKGYENCIKFCGHKPRRTLVELYKSSAVLVLPSFTRLEAFGIVLLEAMACETPVIASQIPGVLDVIGEGGFLVKPCSSQSIATAIQHIFENPANARRMGKKGRQLVEQKYDWKIVAQQVLGVYSKVQD
ncbi:MAG: glycosyltransferase family 4 protein [Euryarchaeota archaeon]|nr:glycosyltransferase family 4 protein [Euryarchaeota archaeon]